MNDKNEPTIAAVLITWTIILLTAVVSASWPVIVICLGWVGLVEFVKHFIHWFSH